MKKLNEYAQLGHLNRSFLVWAAANDRISALSARHADSRVIEVVTQAMRHYHAKVSHKAEWIKEAADTIIGQYMDHISVEELIEVFWLGRSGHLPGGSVQHRSVLTATHPYRITAPIKHYLDEIVPVFEQEKKRIEQEMQLQRQADKQREGFRSFEYLCSLRMEELERPDISLDEVTVTDFWMLQELGIVNSRSLPMEERQQIRAEAEASIRARYAKKSNSGGAIMQRYLQRGRNPEDQELEIRSLSARISVVRVMLRMKAQAARLPVFNDGAIDL